MSTRVMDPLMPIRAVRRHLRAQRRYDALAGIYDNYAAFTMIPRADYILNLQLAEKVESVPGAVVECGVWRGGMIAGMAELLGPSREYVLCDSFQGLPPAEPALDGRAAVEWQANTDDPEYYDNCSAPEEAARAAMALAPAHRVRFVAGWFDVTLADVRPDGGIALLRLDADWYESTKTCLQQLYDRVVPGGLIVIDDYHTWDGCTRAVHDFLAARRLNARISQWANSVCYIRVPAAQR